MKTGFTLFSLLFFIVNLFGQTKIDTLIFDLGTGSEIFKLDLKENDFKYLELGIKTESINSKRIKTQADYFGNPTGKKHRVYIKSVFYDSLGIELHFMGYNKEKLVLIYGLFKKPSLIYIKQLSDFGDKINREMIVKELTRLYIRFEEKADTLSTDNLVFLFNEKGKLIMLDIR